MVNLLDEGYVRKIISDIETSQNKERREEEIKAFEVYSGNLKEHVENRLQQIYPKTYASFTIADLNLSRKITDKLAKAYKQNPVRELQTEEETESYTQLMSDIDAANAWQTFDVYYNLHRYAAMWFSYVPQEDGEDKLLLRPLTPFQFSRVVNSIGETEVFIVNFPTNDMYETTDTDGRKAIIQDSHQDQSCRRYAMWSNEQHVVIRYYEIADEKTGAITCKIVYENIDGNEDNRNPLGIIPAVFAQQGDNCALPIINPLTHQTIEYNQQYSVMLTGASLQTFGHLVLKHPAEQKMPDEIYNSLFTYSRLPQVDGEVETTLDYLNPSPNLNSNLEVMSNYGHQIITEHLGDGSQNVKGSDNFTSGLDRMIAMSDITNKIESNQQVYSRAENGLFKIIKKYYEERNDMKFRSENISVKYNKSKPIQSESEILANIEKKIDLGLIERHEALMILDPNISAEAAKDKIEAVKQEKMQNMSDFMGDISADQEEQDQL